MLSELPTVVRNGPYAIYSNNSSTTTRKQHFYMPGPRVAKHCTGSRSHHHGDELFQPAKHRAASQVVTSYKRSGIPNA